MRYIESETCAVQSLKSVKKCVDETKTMMNQSLSVCLLIIDKWRDRAVSRMECQRQGCVRERDAQPRTAAE